MRWLKAKTNKIKAYIDPDKKLSKIMFTNAIDGYWGRYDDGELEFLGSYADLRDKLDAKILEEASKNVGQWIEIKNSSEFTEEYDQLSTSFDSPGQEPSYNPNANTSY